MAKRQWDWSGADRRSEKKSEDRSIVSLENADRDQNADLVGGVGEVPVPPGGLQAPKEGEVGASNELKTVMEEVEVGEDEMDEGEEKDA